MTVKDLKDMIRDMDDGYTLSLQDSDGITSDITDASLQGDHFTFWTDSTR